MNRFKKRTIALVLATVVSVVGAFGAGNYRNTVMNLSFENTSGGSLNMVVHTRAPFSGTLKPTKKDANTYVLMLPDVNSEAPTPDLSGSLGNIQSVNIRTMPYSANSNGYTRITIKTNNPSVALNASSKIYVPTEKKETGLLENRSTTESSIQNSQTSSVSNNDEQRELQERRRQEMLEQQRRQREVEIERQARLERERAMQQQAQSQQQSYVTTNPNENNNQTVTLSTKPADMVDKPVNPYTERILLILGSLLILFVGIYSAMRAKDKIRDLAGESINIEFDDEPKKPKQEKKPEKPVKKAVKKQSTTSYKQIETEIPSMPATPVKTVKPAEELNVVDLDELFQEHQSKSQETSSAEDDENAALEDFLSGFSFDEEFGNEEVEEDESEKLREELYQEIINSQNIKFSKNDIECIKQILDSEINDETKRNIEKYAVSNPITKKPTKKQILEEIVTTYAISQHINFTSEDVATIYKLISVEIDQDFLTDVRANPEKVMKMEKDILSFGEKPKKPSEIITLSVKDMLPDLSDALKKQGGKRIESNKRAETVYFSEGYEVKKLKFNDVLPDLSAEINKSTAYVSKPSAAYDLVDYSYDVDKLNISNTLPDLKDVMANPDKYSKPEPEKVVVDEKALLNNLTNLEFKPFYDGTQDFEVLNEAPSVNDIQEEFSQFGNFEIHQDDNYEKPVAETNYDDFETFFSEDYVDLDSEEISKELSTFFEEKQTVYQGPVIEDTVEEEKETEESSGDLELDLSSMTDSSAEIPLLKLDETLPTVNEELKPEKDAEIIREQKEVTPKEQPKEVVKTKLELNEQKPQVAAKPVEQKVQVQPKPQQTITEKPVVNSQIKKTVVEKKEKEDFVPLKLERQVPQQVQKRENTDRSNDLMKKIEQTKIEREKIRARIARASEQQKTEKPTPKVVVTSTKCIIDGVNYNVLSSVNLTPNTGCHLVKNEEGYAVLGFVGRKMTKLISYDSLKSEKIQARINEKISDTESRYIIRIGLNKFLIKADANNIEFVMNLC